MSGSMREITSYTLAPLLGMNLGIGVIQVGDKVFSIT
jgi:hypothetical protein